MDAQGRVSHIIGISADISQLKATDQALYQAKHNERDRVVVGRRHAAAGAQQ